MALVTDKEAPADVPSTDTYKQPVQGALIDAAFVKFAGTSGGELEDPPTLDEVRTYVVQSKCKKIETTLRADHEERLTVTMEILSCFEQGKVPIVDEPQPSLFEDPNPGDTEGESGIDLSGVDRPAFSDDDQDEGEADDEDTDE